MKTNYNLFKIVTVALLFSYNAWSQATIAQWNFNGPSNTEVPGGVSAPTPSVGAGTAELVGGTTATFNSGISGNKSSDPVTTSPPNFGWTLTNFAPLGTENKLRGAQFNVSTVGYNSILFIYDHRHSNTSSNTFVVQYTTDRTAGSPVWVDAQVFTFAPGVSGTTGGDRWINLRTVDLSSISTLDNNPNVAFRVVSAFDPTTGNYNSSTEAPTVYSPNGTARLDMVTVSGTANLGTASFESAKNSFKVYPNPSNREVVRFNQAQDIKVYDTLGKLILSAKNTSSIDTKSFNTGIYFIKTATGMTKKLIVK